MVVRPGHLAIRVVEKTIFSTVFGFTSYWDYESYNEHINQKTKTSVK